jgi:hypothetical protein
MAKTACAWFSPRRLLVAAIVCLVAAALLAFAAVNQPPPSQMSEPPQRREVFAGAPILTVSGGVEALVPFSQMEKNTPTYAFNCEVRSETHTTRSLSYGLRQAADSTFGLFKRSGQWSYRLSANRLDRLGPTSELPTFATSEQLERWKPMLIAELNKGSETERKGDQLVALLGSPVTAQTWVCWQNAVVLLAWASPALALLLLVGAGLSMLVATRTPRDRQITPAE